MQRPQSLDFKGVNKERINESLPPMISYELKSDSPTHRMWSVSILPPRTDNQQYVKLTTKPTYKIENRPGGRFISLDQQIVHLNRLTNQLQKANVPRAYSGLPQSQSFTQSIYRSPLNAIKGTPHIKDCNNHTSRLIASTYMTPPPKDWITVGNIIPVKRSVSMPGHRAGNTNLSKPLTENQSTNQAVTKKKSGPFQCLKHSIRKSTVPNSDRKSSIMSNKPPISPALSYSMQCPREISEKPKQTSKSIFKKKTTAPSSTSLVSTKPKGIKKSISLFFSSKSYRTAKSDPSNLDRSAKSNDNESSSPSDIAKNEREFSFKSTARLNHSYESMLRGDDQACSISVYTDTAANRRSSYSSMDDNSSIHYSNSVGPPETIDRVRTPSESSLPDTASICSSGHHVFAYNASHNNNNNNNSNPTQCNYDQHSIAATSIHGNLAYRPGDNCWKTVVGNVCRSNSKDSAIANSTLSADGIISQSKRTSQISTMSRTSDTTQTSEDFNDSSYSSFNDLQVYTSQIYHKKHRIKPIVPKLEPIDLEVKQQESPNGYDSSPFSGSSTETLRPLSCLLRPRFLSTGKDGKGHFHSNTIIKRSLLTMSSEHLKLRSLRHSHSWPDCDFVSGCKIAESVKLCVVNNKSIPIQQHAVTIPMSMIKMEHYPQLKFDKLNYQRINNSPLLSQYSRLYSLKSGSMQQRQQHTGLPNSASGQFSSMQPPLSPIKYSSRTYKHFSP